MEMRRGEESTFCVFLEFWPLANIFFDFQLSFLPRLFFVLGFFLRHLLGFFQHFEGALHFRHSSFGIGSSTLYMSCGGIMLLHFFFFLRWWLLSSTSPILCSSWRHQGEVWQPHTSITEREYGVTQGLYSDLRQA